MPTTRSRKRTGSASSDSGISNSLPSPLGLGVAINPRPLPEEDQDPFLEGGALASLRLDSASLSCCNPRGCILGPIEHGLATPTTQEVVRMICSNDKCPYSPFMHSECFENFEEQILSCLRGMSRAKSWSEKQRRQNLWTKKGYDLIFKFCGCQCGKGNLRKDLNHVLPDPPLPSLPSSSSSSSVTIATDKSKKKRKKSSSLSSDRPSSAQAPPTHAPPTQSHHAPHRRGLVAGVRGTQTPYRATTVSAITCSRSPIGPITLYLTGSFPVTSSTGTTSRWRRRLRGR